MEIEDSRPGCCKQIFNSKFSCCEDNCWQILKNGTGKGKKSWDVWDTLCLKPIFKFKK